MADARSSPRVRNFDRPSGACEHSAAGHDDGDQRARRDESTHLSTAIDGFAELLAILREWDEAERLKDAEATQLRQRRLLSAGSTPRLR